MMMIRRRKSFLGISENYWIPGENSGPMLCSFVDRMRNSRTRSLRSSLEDSRSFYSPLAGRNVHNPQDCSNYVDDVGSYCIRQRVLLLCGGPSRQYTAKTKGVVYHTSPMVPVQFKPI